MNVTLEAYLWVLVVAILGGVTGALTKYRKNATREDGSIAPVNYKILLINIASSIFISFIAYWFVRDNVDSEKLAVAIAGIVSFLGADFLELLAKKKTGLD